jgi:hypothetical protein
LDDYLKPAVQFRKDYVATLKKTQQTTALNEFGISETQLLCLKDFCIIDSETEEPFYFILNRMSNIQEKKWIPLPGSQNIFHCITLFGYLIKKYCHGQIASVSLNTRSCDFLNNFQTKNEKQKKKDYLNSRWF